MKNFRRNVKAVSTVLATLLMIAVAVAASLVAYAWVMGYIGGTTGKVGKAIQIQSVARQGNNLMVYVQNVGIGSLTLSDIYVNGLKQTVTYVPNPPMLPENQTASCTISGYCSGWASGSSHDLTVRAVTSDGTFMEATKTIDVP
jgi:FlaG/FlaF family flagellin (archaellin)